MTNAVVVGGGLGGLATAIRLAHRGCRVTVLEQNPRMGGRCNLLTRDGYTFDTGPTLLLMRDVLDELFGSVGESVEDSLNLIRLEPNYRIHFGDGSSLQVSGDIDATCADMERVCPGSSPGFKRYLMDAGYKYQVSRRRFVERNFLHLRDFVTLANLYYLITTQTLRALDEHAGRYFKDPRLQAAFTFQSMYLGLPPSHAPSVYSLLPYTELAEGIWFPEGGMYRIVLSLIDVAQDLGVRLETSTTVGEIVVRGRRAVGVRVGADVVEADVIVSNADLPYTYSNLLPNHPWKRRFPPLNYGSSVYLLFIAGKRRYPDALHHSVYLSRDIAQNYRALFRDQELPVDPSLYMCIASRSDPRLAPAGRDGLYVLVPVPHQTANIAWKREEQGFRERVLAQLKRVGFEDLHDACFIETMTPDDLASAYNLANGSAFGLAHNFLQVGYMRPSNKARGLENVYFCGASTVPGGGVPMVVIGSRLTTERIMGDLKDG